MGPELVAADAGNQVESVEDRDLGIGYPQALEHKEAVERAGQPHGKGPGAVEEGGAAEIGVFEGAQEHLQAARAVGIGDFFGIRSVAQGEIAQQSDQGAASKDVIKGVQFLGFGTEVEKLSYEETSDDGDDAADNSLAAGEAALDSLRGHQESNEKVQRIK